MYALQRRREIIKILQERGFAPVSELSEIFGVSEVTIRTDLKILKQEGKVERNYGGAALVEESNSKAEEIPPFSYVRQLLSENKSAIAAAAAEMVHQGDSLFLDASSTTLHLAALLREIPDITVISNSIPVFEEFSEYRGGTLIGIPGMLNPVTQSFIGHYAEQMIRELRANKAFITPKAILSEGLRDSSMAEAVVRKAMMDSAEEVIVLADYSKFRNQRTLFGIDSFDRINTIVTDKTLDMEFMELFDKKGIRVVIAGEENK